MSIRRNLAALVAVASFGTPTAVGAQTFDSEVRLDQLQPPSAGSPFTRAEGPHEAFDEGLAYAFRVAADYAYAPLRSGIVGGALASDDDATPVRHALLVHVGGSISPLYWLNFEINFPMAPMVMGDNDKRIPQKRVNEGKGGVGDIRIGALVQPFTSEAADFDLGLRVWLPLGTSESYLGTKGHFTRFEAVASIAGDVDVLLYGCTLGLAPLFFAGRDGDRVAMSCAAHFKVAPIVSVGVEPHVALFSYAGDDVAPGDRALPGLGNDNLRVQFEPLAAATFHFGDFSLGLAAGPGLGGAPGTAAVRSLVSFGYAAHGERVVEEVVHDADLDGVEDQYDACPDQAGPTERRGCPSEQDEDGDGIIKGDACPDEPGTHYDDPQANGCPDRDNDHFADPVDPCPIEPGPVGKGCPAHARLKGNAFTVKPPIAFRARSAKLTKTSIAALIEIIQTLRANPDIEQVSVSVGTRGARQRLTDNRAATILALFADQSMPTDRFEVVLNDKLRAGRVRVRAIR